RAAQRGFTLLEILAVLVIVGILVTLAVLSIGGEGQQAHMQTASQRMHQVLELASQEAIVRNLKLGIVVNKHGYHFVMLNREHKWVTYTKALPLKPHHVHSDINLLILVQGLKAGLTKTDKETAPQAVFLSSGEVTPFSVQI